MLCPQKRQILHVVIFSFLLLADKSSFLISDLSYSVRYKVILKNAFLFVCLLLITSLSLFSVKELDKYTLKEEILD